MNFINQFSIKVRILILVLIPVVVTLVFAVQRYQQADKTLSNIEKLETLQLYVSKVSPLISALYKERLFSKLYVGPGKHSDIGSRFKQQLLNSQSAVNSPLKNFQEFIANKELFEPFPKLKKDIERIEISLEVFALARAVAARKERLVQHPNSEKKEHVLGVMNTLVADLISSSQQVVLLSASNENLSLLTSAYQNLLHAQDALMLVIGNIYEVSEVKVSVPTFANLMRQVGQERMYLKGFQNYAPSEVDKFFQQEIQQQDFFQKAQELYEKIRRMKPEDFSGLIELDTNAWLNQGEQMVAAYDKVSSYTLSEIEKTKNEVLNNAQQAVTQTIVLIIALLVILAFVSLAIIRSINAPLKSMIRDFQQLADSKDMTLRTQVDGNNELTSVGNAFNSLITSFEQTLLKVRQQVLSMDEVTSRVANSMEGSMSLINEQKSATDSISVAVNQMTATIHEVANMSSSTADVVNRANELATSGEQDAQYSRKTMNELFEELGETSQLVAELNNEAGQINNILQVIRGISEQTNLLALNAAIEAARAGEAGRGFAVVADEVRELSRRTHESTEQIQKQIETLTAGAQAATTRMEQLQLNGSNAVEVVEKSSESFITIKNELEQITDMSCQIAVASEEQTNVADEINKRVHIIKDGSESMFNQGTVAMTDIQSLKENESNLKADIEEFRF